MQIPEKTFLTKKCELSESDFESNGDVKPLRVMQLMQNVATAHAEKLGVGWNTLNDNAMLWVLSKVKIVFARPVTRNTESFSLYTWPLEPNRFYSERCFTATEGDSPLFFATSLWTMISRDERKILPATTMNEFYRGEYSAVKADVDSDFCRVRFDDTFEFCYEKTVRRSDLDKNGHVNNTNYVVIAEDALAPEQRVSAMEIVYHKELKLGDKVSVFVKTQNNRVFVVGRRTEETCFTVAFTLGF